jgi:hypothetical protein
MNICQDSRTKLSSPAFPNPMPIRFQARTDRSRASAFSEEELQHERAETNNSRPRAATEIRRYVDCYTWDDSRQCVLADSFASISRAGNSRLSGPASGGTRHHRRYPSLVGAGRLHSKVGAENRRDRRATRRTRFSRTKPICGRQNILPHLSALSLHSSATATTRLYS